MTEGSQPGNWGWGFLSDKSNTDRSTLLLLLCFVITNLKHNNNNRADLSVFDLVLNYCYV